ncbi:MAG: hypothetical protein WBG17_08320 [Burkholderiaceae bacterium]
MMQTNEIRQRFDHIEQSVRQAAQACASSSNVPQDLKQCITQLDQQTSQAEQVMQSQDEGRIRQCVDQLEELGDRAKMACQNSSGGIDDNLKKAVIQAHSELSTLKHQLH